MPATYRFFAEFAQTYGLLYFFAVFLLVVAWAFWPSRRKQFEEAAQIPLRDD